MLTQRNKPDRRPLAYRLEPLPLKFVRSQSLRKAHRRHPLNPKWETVELAHGRAGSNNRFGWWLACRGMPSTGPFATKQKAIASFPNTGR